MVGPAYDNDSKRNTRDDSLFFTNSDGSWFCRLLYPRDVKYFTNGGTL
jgi:hypothetical protein